MKRRHFLKMFCATPLLTAGLCNKSDWFKNFINSSEVTALGPLPVNKDISLIAFPIYASFRQYNSTSITSVGFNDLQRAFDYIEKQSKYWDDCWVDIKETIHINLPLECNALNINVNCGHNDILLHGQGKITSGLGISKFYFGHFRRVS